MIQIVAPAHPFAKQSTTKQFMWHYAKAWTPPKKTARAEGEILDMT